MDSNSLESESIKIESIESESRSLEFSRTRTNPTPNPFESEYSDLVYPYWPQQTSYPQFVNTFSPTQRPQSSWYPPPLQHLMDLSTPPKNVLHTPPRPPLPQSSQADQPSHPTQPPNNSRRNSSYQQRSRQQPDSQRPPTNDIPSQNPSSDRSVPQLPNL